MQVDPASRAPVSSAHRARHPPHHHYSMSSFKVFGTLFVCPLRYRLIRAIGKGAYGIVCSAEDQLTGEKVAIKKIVAIADDAVDCKRTLREMRLLRHFQHENVVGLKDVYIPDSTSGSFRDVYTVTELMDTDLHQVISSRQPLTDEHVQYFTYQLLRAVKHIHSANVLHRDLKPSNILLNADCSLKICDFGLARSVDNPDGKLTIYVQTRWYRAPEIMLMGTHYTKKVDVWSIGCILGEIVRQRPLFPGSCVMSQMKLVCDVLGSPTPDDLPEDASDSVKRFVTTELADRGRGKGMDEVFPEAPTELQNLLGRMLVFDPRKRISVDEALDHPYLARLRRLDEQVDGRSEPFVFEYDDEAHVGKERLRRAVWEEAQSYRRP